jgi:DNA replication regulator SLD3
MVLIARLDDRRTSYVVEREDRGLYVVCKLGSWVNLRQLRALAAATSPDGSAFPDKSTQLEHSALADNTAPDVSAPTKFSKRKRLAIEAIQSMVKRPTTGLLSETHTEELPLWKEPLENVGTAGQVEVAMSAAAPEPETITPPTTDDMLENIRNQYFDALYLSKACHFLLSTSTH